MNRCEDLMVTLIAISLLAFLFTGIIGIDLSLRSQQITNQSGNAFFLLLFSVFLFFQFWGLILIRSRMNRPDQSIARYNLNEDTKCRLVARRFTVNGWVLYGFNDDNHPVSYTLSDRITPEFHQFLEGLPSPMNLQPLEFSKETRWTPELYPRVETPCLQIIKSKKSS